MILGEKAKKPKVNPWFMSFIFWMLSLTWAKKFLICNIPITQYLLSLSITTQFRITTIPRVPRATLHLFPVCRTDFWELRSGSYLPKLEIGACGNMKR